MAPLSAVKNSVIKSENILIVYINLIVLFYERTNGFDLEASPPLLYSTLKALPCFLLFVFNVVSSQEKDFQTERRRLAFGFLFGALADFVISYGTVWYSEPALVPGAYLFGIGHLFSISSFCSKIHKLSKKLTIGVSSYVFIMFCVFMLPNMSLAVLVFTIYSIILSLCLITSGSIYLEGRSERELKQKEDLIRFIGYILFFVSDSLILMESFSSLVIPNCELCILVTYFSSQYLISLAAQKKKILL